MKTKSLLYGFCSHCNVSVHLDLGVRLARRDPSGKTWILHPATCGCRITREEFDQVLHGMMRDVNLLPTRGNSSVNSR